MGVLNDIGLRYDADKSSRFHNYLDFYEKHLPGRDFSGRLLEIGVMDGFSMRMWREYYPRAEIIGLDIKDMHHLYNDTWQVPKSVQLLKLDGTNAAQLKPLGMFDIIIDDGSHMTADQQKSFEILYYNQLNAGGIYILEDLWTSYVKYHQNAKITTVEYLKRLEKKGMKINWFHHKHTGIQSVFPEEPGLDKLGSITSVIKAGQ